MAGSPVCFCWNVERQAYCPEEAVSPLVGEHLSVVCAHQERGVGAGPHELVGDEVVMIDDGVDHGLDLVAETALTCDK